MEEVKNSVAAKRIKEARRRRAGRDSASVVIVQGEEHIYKVTAYCFEVNYLNWLVGFSVLDEEYAEDGCLKEAHGYLEQNISSLNY